MNEMEMTRMLNDEYDESRENSIREMLGNFYNRKMRSVVILVWAFALLCIAGAAAVAVLFFKTDQVKLLILYGVLFIVLAHWVDLIKIFAWQMIHRNSLRRELKRLELRIAELSETMKSK